MVCEGGHIDDFPYKAWVHGRSGAKEGSHHLKMTNLGITASLRDIVIRCSCGKSRSMEGAFRRNALKDIAWCSANQPWLSRADPDGCSRMPRVLQRGASNVWFSIVESAISIPPWSEDAFKALNRYWEAIRHVPDEALVSVLTGMELDRNSGYTVEELAEAARERREAEDDSREVDAALIKDQEYTALTRGRAQRSAKQDFVCLPATEPTPWVAEPSDQ
jgi:hypothetical protein